MTYNQARDWCVDNVPMGMFNNFDDWYEQCESELNTPNLTENDNFYQMMQTAWENTRPDEEELEQEDEIYDSTDTDIDQDAGLAPPLEPEPIQAEMQPVTQEPLPTVEPLPTIRPRTTIDKIPSLSGALSAFPKGTTISIPQLKGAPIQIKPSTSITGGVTMTRPPITPAPTVPRPQIPIPQVVRIAPTITQRIRQVGSTIASGFKRLFGR